MSQRRSHKRGDDRIDKSLWVSRRPTFVTSLVLPPSSAGTHRKPSSKSPGKPELFLQSDKNVAPEVAVFSAPSVERVDVRPHGVSAALLEDNLLLSFCHNYLTYAHPSKGFAGGPAFSQNSRAPGNLPLPLPLPFAVQASYHGAIPCSWCSVQYACRG